MCQIFLETRMFRLSDGGEIMTLAFFVLIQYRSVTDRQTDRRTDGHLCSGYTSACIACYANALVKIVTLHFPITFNVIQQFRCILYILQFLKHRKTHTQKCKQKFVLRHRVSGAPPLHFRITSSGQIKGNAPALRSPAPIFSLHSSPPEIKC